MLLSCRVVFKWISLNETSLHLHHYPLCLFLPSISRSWGSQMMQHIYLSSPAHSWAVLPTYIPAVTTTSMPIQRSAKALHVGILDMFVLATWRINRIHNLPPPSCWNRSTGVTLRFSEYGVLLDVVCSWKLRVLVQCQVRIDWKDCRRVGLFCLSSRYTHLNNLWSASWLMVTAPLF